MRVSEIDGKRYCKNCVTEYKYKTSANFMVFCPNCGRFDNMECEYGYGPVVPCEIYYKSEVIGIVTIDADNGSRYRLDSEAFDLHIVLDHTYMEALDEAREIISDMINEKGC